MLRFLIRIFVVVLLVQHLEARLAAPSLLDSVKGAAKSVANTVTNAATKFFAVTARAKFNGAASALKDTDTSCVMCQYFVQRIQGYSILYASQNPGSLLEESSELRPATSSVHAHVPPADMSQADYEIYLEIVRRLDEAGHQAVDKQESTREEHVRKQVKANQEKWVTPEFDEATKGKGLVDANELPGADTTAVDIENKVGDTNPNAVPAVESKTSASSSPSTADEERFQEKSKKHAASQTTDKKNSEDDEDEEDKDSTTDDSTDDSTADSTDSNDVRDETDDDDSDKTADDDSDETADDADDADDVTDASDDSDDSDEDSDDSDDSEDTDDSADQDTSSLLELQTKTKTKSKSKSKSKSKTRAPTFKGFSGYSGRYRVSDQKLWRPVPARFAPVHPYLPNAMAEASRLRLIQMYQLVYASFETICTLRQPFEMAQYCGELESRYRTVAEGLRYGDRPDEICMEIDMCDKDAYIRNVAHTTPPPPTSPSAWVPIASNILLNYPEDQAATNLKLALTSFTAAQTASILLQAGLIAVNQDPDAMAESIRILGKFSGQKPTGWVKEKAFQIWVLATIVAKGSAPGATAVNAAAATQANTYLQSSQDNSAAISRLVSRFAADGYTAARTSNAGVQAQFVSLITDQ